MSTTQAEAVGRDVARHARLTQSERVPWVPIGDGKAFKPLRFFRDNRGCVELLRLDPGVEIGWHRHTGEVHAYNLQGTRELHTGETVQAGDYVFEPVSNTDRWRAAGDTPLIVFVVVMGVVEYLGAGAKVADRYDGNRLYNDYKVYCERHGIDLVDLYD